MRYRASHNLHNTDNSQVLPLNLRSRLRDMAGPALKVKRETLQMVSTDYSSARRCSYGHFLLALAIRARAISRLATDPRSTVTCVGPGICRSSFQDA